VGGGRPHVWDHVVGMMLVATVEVLMLGCDKQAFAACRPWWWQGSLQPALPAALPSIRLAIPCLHLYTLT
jgi:hypothetical protein